jgi:hypothetical protein
MAAQTGEEKAYAVNVIYRLDGLTISFKELVRSPDSGRNPEQVEQVLDALQYFKENRPFKVALTETIKDLCLSLDPIKIQQGWQQLYQKWQLSIEIPAVPYDTKRIQEEKEERGRVLVFALKTLTDKEGLITLGKLFPAMGSWSTKPGSSVVVEPVLFGWMFVESSLDAPNRNTTEPELREVFAKQNAKGYGLPVYIIFGQFCKEVFGSYPDINTWSRLLGSSRGGGVLSADFHSDGSLSVDRGLNPENSHGNVGGRSAVVR